MSKIGLLRCTFDLNTVFRWDVIPMNYSLKPADASCWGRSYAMPNTMKCVIPMQEQFT